MSNNNINPSNYHKNRRELKTTFSKSDFNLKLNKYKISCSDLLVNHLYCNICFDSYENSLTSYNGKVFNLKNSTSVAEITNECIELISNMSMGADEYYKLLESLK